MLKRIVIMRLIVVTVALLMLTTMMSAESEARQGKYSPKHRLYDDCQFARDNPDRRIRSCSILIKRGGVYVPVFYANRGVAYRSKGDLTQAIADLNRAIELAPSPDFYWVRANIYYDMGNLARTRADLRKAIQLKPDFAAPRHMLSRISGGR